MKKGILITLGLLVLILIGVGVYRNMNQQDDKEVIKIGAIIPLTGEVATYGESLKKGFDIAVEEENGAFEIIYEDSRFDKKVAIAAVNKLLSKDKAQFFLGDATSGVTLTIAPILENNKAILMVPIATSDDIKDAGDFIFRNAPRNEKQAAKVAQMINKQPDLKSFAILYQQNDYGLNILQKFKAELVKEKRTELNEFAYNAGTTDYKNILYSLKETKPELVFLPGSYEDVARILKQMRELGINAKAIGTDGAYSPKLIEIAGQAAEGFEFTMMSIDENSQLYKLFQQKYLAKYNEQPDIFTSYGYESARLLIESIKSAGKDTEKVRDYLYKTEFQSLTNSLRFDDDGEVIREY